MIKTEYFRTRDDGAVLNRSYSNIGMMIERDGVLYSEAIDSADSGRTYTETEQPIADDTEAEIEDYEAALSSLGVDV